MPPAIQNGRTCIYAQGGGTPPAAQKQAPAVRRSNDVVVRRDTTRQIPSCHTVKCSSGSSEAPTNRGHGQGRGQCHPKAYLCMSSVNCHAIGKAFAKRETLAKAAGSTDRR